MADSFDVRIEGDIELVAELRAKEGRAAEWRRKTVLEAARTGVSYMRELAPRSTATKTGREGWPASVKGKLNLQTSTRGGRGYDSLYKRVERSAPVFRPGGAGGGGTWVATFGVKADKNIFGKEWKDPALLVARGTGIFAGRGRIRSDKGKMLTFMQGGKQVFTFSVKGQEAQTAWIRIPRNKTRQVIRERVRRFDLKTNAR